MRDLLKKMTVHKFKETKKNENVFIDLPCLYLKFIY